MSENEQTRMRITTVRLPDDIADAADHAAARLGISTSEFVREAVLLRLAVAVAITEAGGQSPPLATIAAALQRRHGRADG